MMRNPAMIFLAALLIAACGGTDGGDADAAVDAEGNALPPEAAAPATPAASTLDATLSEWAIALSNDSIAPGVFTINVRNTGTVPHALQIVGGGQDIATDRIEPGSEVSMSLDLVAGDYKLFCPVDSAGVPHETKGMVTRLRVH